uniref:Wu:fj64h06 n=1 Tax=Salarias fasciatus TaxID=181472 RepID=A0A672G5P0_SALFA
MTACFPSVLRCRQTYYSLSLNRYCCLLSDVVPSVPPDLLGPLLHEELAEQRDRLLFCEAAAGALWPSSPSPRAAAACSIQDTIPGGPHGDRLVVSGLVGARLDHLCGVWSFSEQNEPRLLQAVKTSETATCVSLSPHVCGEVLVASESGAAHLWTVGKGMQKVRAEDSNLYFNARSRWRWCEFSAHPRVALVSGPCDLRPVCVSDPHTLFRISSSSECRNGERLILVRYLRDAHCFHHLVTTQYSAYIVDERFPGVPMLKLDHQMRSPPVFCHVVPEEGRSTKMLLGSRRCQEVTLLQYSGQSAGDACSSRGPPQALLRAADSLEHLPVLIPHQQSAAAHRLSAPATGTGTGLCVCVCTLSSSPPQDLTPPALSRAALATWKHWLQTLMQSSTRDKPRPPSSSHFIVSTEDLLKPVNAAPSGSGGLQEVGEYLRSCMSRRSLALSAPVQDPDLVPVPEQVDTEAWTDPLSRRLTASWQGEEAWLAWWEEELGTHREAKAQALRRKRRREKEARRAAGQQLELSASFSSSASGPSELDDFSTHSQVPWFDTEWTARPYPDPGLERDPTETDAPAGPPTGEEADPQTPTGTGTPDPSPAPEKRREPLAAQVGTRRTIHQMDPGREKEHCY